MLGLPPEAQSQSLTTITSLITVTTPTSITKTSTSETTSIETYTTTVTSTSLVGSPKTLLKENVRLKVPGAGYGCFVDYRNFRAHDGDVVSFNLAAPAEFTVYIMGDKDYQTWEKAGKCSPGAVSDFSGGFSVTSYVEDLVMSRDGIYWVVLLNSSHTNTVTVQLNVQITGTATIMAVTTTTGHIQQKYSTATLPTTTTIVQTSRRTEQVMFGIPFLMLLAIVGVVVVIVAGVLAFTLMSKRRPKSQRSASSMEPELSSSAIPQVGKKFCISCAAELPQEAKFCNKCGATQP